MKPINRKHSDVGFLFRNALCTLMIFVSFSCNDRVSTSNKNEISSNNLKLIQFKNLGPSDKPVPNVVFYTETFDSLSLKYGKSFKLSYQDVKSIAEIVSKKADLRFEKFERFYYQISIVDRYSKTVFYDLQNKILVSEFFHDISNSLKDSSQRTKVSSYLNDYVLPGLF